jgi:tetratricopeptide (TPR) repeat protein
LDARRGSYFGAALVIALGAVGTPNPAHAQQARSGESMSQATTRESDMDDERARGAFRLGAQYYQQGRFAEAAAEFERAYGLSGRAQLLYNAYLAHRDAREDEGAARTLRGYLAQVEEVPDREHLQARLEALERGLSAQRERDAAAQAQTDEARREAEEARRQAEEAGRPRTREVAGEAWPWGVAGVGAAMLVAGAVTGGLAMAERSDLDALCPLQLCPAGTNVDARTGSLEGLALATDVLLFGGGAIALTGVVLGLVLGPRTEVLDPAALPVTAGCSSTGCFVSLRGEL